MLKRFCCVLLFAVSGSALIPVIPATSTSSEAQLVAGYRPPRQGGKMPPGGGPGTRMTGGQDVGTIV